MGKIRRFSYHKRTVVVVVVPYFSIGSKGRFISYSIYTRVYMERGIYRIEKRLDMCLETRVFARVSTGFVRNFRSTPLLSRC